MDQFDRPNPFTNMYR